MGRADYLQLGDWNVQCYQCGRKRKGSTMKKHWQGYWVCPEHWEPRHPQDFVRNVPDDMTPPWSQPQPAPVFTIPRGAVDGLGLTEHIAWVIIRTRALVDSFTLAEDITGVTDALFDSLGVADSVRMDVAQNPQEVLSLGEVVGHQVFNDTQLNGFVLNGLALNSNKLLEISLVLGDGLSVGDALNGVNSKSLADSLSLAEAVGVDAQLRLADTCTITDIPDYQIFTPTQLNGFALNGLVINSNNLVSGSVVLGDSLTLTDSVSSSRSLSVSDSAALTDSLGVSFGKTLGDSTSMSDSLSHQWFTAAQINGLQLNGASLNGN